MSWSARKLPPQTGKKVVPVAVFKGITIIPNDLKTFHGEGDVIIVQQMLELATNGISCINIPCDDTDVFALLLYYYVHCHLLQWKVPALTEC